MITFDEKILSIINDFTYNAKDLKLTIGTIYLGKKEYVIYNNSQLTEDNKLYYYEIGSLTKSFTALLIMKAIDEGKINLIDKINKHLPFLPKDKEYPTIKALLTHTAGYPNDILKGKMICSLFFKKIKQGNPYLSLSSKGIEAKILKYKSKSLKNPYCYSNFGYATLARILEEIYQKPFNELMKSFIQNDLHLYETDYTKESIIYNNPQNESLFIKGYTRKEMKETSWLFDKPNLFQASTGLISNINDLMEYCFMIMTNRKKYMNSVKEKLINIDEVSNMSAGWQLIINDSMMTQNGQTGGFDSSILMCPNLQMAVVVLANYGNNTKKEYSTETISYRIMNSMIETILEQIKEINKHENI